MKKNHWLLGVLTCVLLLNQNLFAKEEVRTEIKRSDITMEKVNDETCIKTSKESPLDCFSHMISFDDLDLTKLAKQRDDENPKLDAVSTLNETAMKMLKQGVASLKLKSVYFNSGNLQKLIEEERDLSDLEIPFFVIAEFSMFDSEKYNYYKTYGLSEGQIVLIGKLNGLDKESENVKFKTSLSHYGIWNPNFENSPLLDWMLSYKLAKSINKGNPFTANYDEIKMQFLNDVIVESVTKQVTEVMPQEVINKLIESVVKEVMLPLFESIKNILN